MRFIGLALALLSVMPASAQDFGYTGGLSYAVGGFRGQAQAYKGSDTGWHLGFLFQSNPERDFGYRATFTFHEFAAPSGASISGLGNVDLRWQLTDSTFLLAGPSIGLARQREPLLAQTDSTLALGARVGLGWRMSDRWNLEFSVHGLRVGEREGSFRRSPNMTWAQLGVSWTGFSWILPLRR